MRLDFYNPNKTITAAVDSYVLTKVDSDMSLPTDFGPDSGGRVKVSSQTHNYYVKRYKIPPT